METVTLVSEVETRSIDTLFSLNTVNARARKPTSCHMRTPSIAMSVSPLRMHMPLIWGSTSGVTEEITVPSSSGAVVQRMNKGMA